MRTREGYEDLLSKHILPKFQPMPIRSITPMTVRAWYAKLDKQYPTRNTHIYGLFKTIMKSAVNDQILTVSPANITGALTTKPKHKGTPVTPDQLVKLVEAMPAKYRCMTLMATFTALRFGELTELRRRDVDVNRGVLSVDRGVTRSRKRKEFVVGKPKTDAGKREVSIPPHLLPVIIDHLENRVEDGQMALLFPAANDPEKHLSPSTLYKSFYPAREKIGLPELHWHDLRHTGSTIAAKAGASIPELMARLGHSTANAASRYFHAAQGRDAEVALRISQDFGWVQEVTPVPPVDLDAS
jgi:integrase